MYQWRNWGLSTGKKSKKKKIGAFAQTNSYEKNRYFIGGPFLFIWGGGFLY